MARTSERAIGAAEERRAWARMIERNNLATEKSRIVLDRDEYEEWKRGRAKRYEAKPGGLGRKKGGA
jgi:hypothetical protein